jgi:TRAP-type C4-dicarboxylate transport system substrate-binding protein
MSRKATWALALGLCLGGWLPAGAQTLKIATLAPDGTIWMKELRAGAEEVDQKTGGRVTLRFYPGGVMGNDKTVLRKIRAGQLQGGAFTSGALADVYRDVVIYGLPFIFRSLDEVDFVRARMDDRLKAGLEAGGMVTLGISEGGFAYLLSDKPIRTIDDAKGRRVWIPEGDVISATGLEVAGVTPIPLPIGDVYTALQTGLLDTVATTPAGAIAFQWHTKVKYFVDVPLEYLVGMIVVDRDAFQKLSAGDQATVKEVMGSVLAHLDRLTRADNESAREALRAQGIEFVKPSSEELQRWRAVADESLARLKAKDVYSQESLELLLGYLKEFRERAAGAK